jgi:hypothetical protein
MCLWNEGLWLENFTPREVTVTLISENHRVSQTFTPTYEAYHVNGPNCPGDCQKATVAFTKPLDTSPKALAQTATARPVMLVINQALLQATMLAATAQALDAKIFVAPATATALHGQVAGNLATIEALRPTANSLHIVLMERPVRPTDAPEATLFAQANEAAKAAAHVPVSTPPPGTP